MRENAVKCNVFRPNIAMNIRDRPECNKLVTQKATYLNYRHYNV